MWIKQKSVNKHGETVTKLAWREPRKPLPPALPVSYSPLPVSYSPLPASYAGAAPAIKPRKGRK